MNPYGYKAKTVSITHLPEVQESVGKLVRQGLINKKLHEKWHFYLKTNEILPEAKTIIVVAMPQPVTRIWFKWQGTDFPADIPPTYFAKADDSRAEEILNNVLETAGYRIVKAQLALKTLAVRSGLAKYGRNNISYVPEMGSFCRLIAFYTDWQCKEDNWQESKVMKACEKCFLCRKNCPTGSITADRFLIHAEKCLTLSNEMEINFPKWIQPDWHNALIGCLHCQAVCPVGKPYLSKSATGPTFSEEETRLILNNTPVEKLAHETKRKLDTMIHDEIFSVMVRNLGALIEKQKITTQR